MVKDIGKFLGYFFIIIGCIQLILIFINVKISGDINIQFSFLLNFMAGYYLYNHNVKARKIVMIFMGVMIIVQFFAFIYFTINGIPHGSHVRLFGVEISNFVNFKFVPIIFLFSIIFPVIPFSLLLSRKAIKEFSDDIIDGIKK